jgi:hypothetical protein
VIKSISALASTFTPTTQCSEPCREALHRQNMLQRGLAHVCISDPIPSFKKALGDGVVMVRCRW